VQKQILLLQHIAPVKNQQALPMSLRGALGFAEAVSSYPLGIASSERASALLAKTRLVLLK